MKRADSDARATGVQMQAELFTWPSFTSCSPVHQPPDLFETPLLSLLLGILLSVWDCCEGQRINATPVGAQSTVVAIAICRV